MNGTAAHNQAATVFQCGLQDSVPALIDIHQQHPETFPFLLDTAVGTHGQHRYSLLLARADEAPLMLDFDQLGRAGQTPFLDQVDEAFAREYQPDHAGLPFIGGWFLLLGYELAAQLETRVPAQAPEQPQPVAAAWRCDGAVIIDHQRQTRLLVAESEQRLQQLRLLVAAVRPVLADDIRMPQWRVQAGAGDAFCAGVQQVLEYVRAGDVYQVNLSRGWHASPSGTADPGQDFHVAIYHALRNANAAPFAGLAHLGDSVLLSSSPERLLEIDNGWIQTRPIAGTRPRGRNAQDDERLSDELLAHPKERAEHIMLIDLERNDLGRVCEPGSVEVNELMVKESYASVHHIVSNVRGRLRDGVTPGQAIAAVFPGGTITGCPKVRCMQIIAELEDYGRGFYTGAMGYLSRHGRLDLNILIRSMLWQGGALHWRTGCGIVADSVPEQELAETEAKAAGMLRALGSGGAD